jgi:seryl-tRNA synthetase
LFVVQSLAERAQARTGLLWEAANAHAEAAAAHEAKLRAKIAVAREIHRAKEVMARQAQKEAAELKKKLEDAERKAKDAVADLQAVIEGKSSTLPRADSENFLARRLQNEDVDLVIRSKGSGEEVAVGEVFRAVAEDDAEFGHHAAQ